MRNVFAKCITQLAAINDKIILLSGDIGNKLFDEFKKQYPKRFVNCGIAEANMIGIAAGLALSGFRPIVYTITPFATLRCLEQIRVDVCYHHLPVTIVGTGSGFSYAQLGPTHHSCEDVAILRSLPGMTVFCPCDPVELELGLKVSINLDNPLYIRLGKKDEPILHKEKPDFKFGKSLTLCSGLDCCLLSMGTISKVALESAMILKDFGISARVESLHTIKPLDTIVLQEIFYQYKIVVLIEEHSQIGGLLGAVSEWYIKQQGNLARTISFAVKDEFLHEIGNQNYALQKYGLTKLDIVNAVFNLFDNLKLKRIKCILD